MLLVGLHGAPRELDLTRMTLREVDVFTTVAHVCDSDIPAALGLLAESDIARVTAGPRIPLEALVEDGLRPLAEAASERQDPRHSRLVEASSLGSIWSRLQDRLRRRDR